MSGVNREVHAPFWEGLGVELPWATRPFQTLCLSRVYVRFTSGFHRERKATFGPNRDVGVAPEPCILRNLGFGSNPAASSVSNHKTIFAHRKFPHTLTQHVGPDCINCCFAMGSIGATTTVHPARTA